MSDARHDLDAPHGLRLGILAQVLGYQLTLAALTTRKMFSRHIGESLELKPVDFSILMLLLENEQVTQKRLGQILMVSAPNLTILTDKLQQNGLVERVRSEADRRSQFIHLTPKGLTLAEKAREVAQVMEDDLLDVLSAAERAILLELLKKVSRTRRA